MGSFLSVNKSGTFWFLASYLQDKNIYVTDRRLLPYTPGQLQTYIEYFPALWNPLNPPVVSFYINSVRVGSAKMVDASGLVYIDLSLPLGAFQLEIRNVLGETLKLEHYITKNYAVFLGVEAQSLDERRVEIELTKADQRFKQMRSSSVYPVLGVLFNFPPPPGWTVDEYRAAILGGCGPGFISSFFYGGTLKGVVDTITSMTCDTVTVSRARKGIRWTVFPRSNDPVDPGTLGYYVTTRANMATTFTPPHYRAVTATKKWWQSAVVLSIAGSVRSVVAEAIVKKSNSYVEAQYATTTDLGGKTLQFSVEVLETPGAILTYTVTFPFGTTTAALAAAAIRAVSGTLSDAIHDSPDGKLRLGVYPSQGITQRVTITGGSALADFGYVIGQSVDVSPDLLNNPWVTTAVTLTDSGGATYTSGVDFVVAAETGEIIWPASTSTQVVPSAGTQFTAAYSYQMRREITAMVDEVREVNSNIDYEWLP